jgi:hypothetical protein
MEIITPQPGSHDEAFEGKATAYAPPKVSKAAFVKTTPSAWFRRR